MAEYIKGWLKTSKIEAGYAHNPNDSGEETYRGISIKYNPKWEGWIIIHSVIKNMGIIDTLNANKELREKIDQALAAHPLMDKMVTSFYKENYWDPLNLDDEPDQLIAEQVFDTAVNMGVDTARKLFHTAKEKEDV